MKPAALAWLAIAALPAASLAQAGSDALEEASKNSLPVKLQDGATVSALLKSVVVDMPVTTAPATFLLGAAGTAVPRVATFREASAQIANAVGDDGKIRTSTAFEIVPRLAVGPVQWTDYKADRLTQILTRTSVSFATLTKEAATGAKTAIGVQSVLYSAEAPQLIAAASTGDCRTTADNFAKTTFGRVPGGVKLGGLIDLTPEAKKQAEEAYANCKARIEGLLTKWNPTSLVVGAGQTFGSTTGEARGLRRSASGAWITATWGYDDETAESHPNKPAKERTGVGITVHARRMLHERVADPAEATRLVDEGSRLLGLNLRYGSGKWGVLGEYSDRKGKATGLADEHRKRHFLGFEYRIKDDLYVVAGIGGDRGRRDGKDERVTLMNLKWGFTSESVLR